MTTPTVAPPASPGDHRLLIACQSFDIGGTERHLATLLPALARRRWPITVYCFNSRGAYADAVSASGVEVIGPPVEGRLSHTP